MSSIENVAIIMDGNGRWATTRSHPRVWGHIRGVQVVSQIVEFASQFNLKSLTLYAFSTENWSRPESEIKALFQLLKKFLIRERARILNNHIRFKVIGSISHLSEETQQHVRELEEETRFFEGLKFNLAFNYSGRSEIIHSINKFISENPGKEITEQEFGSYLYNPEIGEIDLLIRTGGDQRISNFLLWQIAYAELYFTQTRWPDFSAQEFMDILSKVKERERRFGCVEAGHSFLRASRLARLQQHWFERFAMIPQQG